MIGGVIIHPYDNDDVIAGQVQSILNRDKIMRCWINLEQEYKNILPQGTIGLELLTQVPDLDIILVNNCNRNDLLFSKLWTLRTSCFLLRFRSLEEA